MTKLTFYTELLDNWHDPELVFTFLYENKTQTFWLDSSKVIEGFSRFSYLGEAASMFGYSLGAKEDIFSILEKKLSEIKISQTDYPFAFTGGYVGYFGYELKALCGTRNKFKSDYPDSIFYFVDRFFAFDQKEKKVYLCCLTKNKKEAQEWFSLIKNKLKLMRFKKEKRIPNKRVELQLEINKLEYFSAIDKCKHFLQNGESYEICLTNRLRGKTSEDPLKIYKRLRKINPAPYAAFFKDSDFAILSSSPERFLQIDQKRWAEAKPMKGTIGRSLNEKKDRALAKQLLKSEKDRAENLMIVDLLRNDLGKVCAIGSVHVSELMKVETYRTLHQMVSTIRGNLRTDVSVLGCIKSCFPGGSMTGAPKKRTMEILDTLEKSARGVYSGAMGYLSANGAVDLNVVIRTIVMDRENISIGAGGAIIYESDPQKEFDEMMLKAKVLQTALTET